MKENEKVDKYLDLARDEKAMEHDGDCGTNYSCCAWNSSQRLGKETERIRNKRKSRPYSQRLYTVKISLNTEKSP